MQSTQQSIQLDPSSLRPSAGAFTGSLRILAGGQLTDRFRHVPLVTGLIVLTMAFTACWGWALDILPMKTLGMGDVLVKANTAVALVLAAIALLVLQSSDEKASRRILFARVVGCVLLVLGALTLFEYASGLNLRIDQLFFQELTRDSIPGRMAAISAFEFVLIGAGLIAVDMELPNGFRPIEPLMVGSAAIALMALLGYGYGAIPIRGLGHGLQIAIPTAICLFLLSAGILGVRLNRGWMKALFSDRAGGVLARRLLPFVFFVPLCLSTARLLATEVGGYSVSAVTAVVAVLTMAAFGIITAGAAKTLNEIDERREEAEAGRRRLGIQRRQSLVVEHAKAQHATRTRNEEELRAKDQILSHVSHELRTPLAAADQFVSILLDGIAGELQGEQREFLEIVMRNLKQLQAMIGDLLDTTQIRGAALVIHEGPVEVSRTANDLLLILSKRAAVKNISLTFVDPDRVTVWADGARVRQILTNLLDNALKFTNSGSVVVKCERLERNGAFVQISVADTGPGIPSSAMEKVFDRLYQVGGSLEPGRNGLGLGLYICRELAQRMGGKLWVESELGFGSTFHLTLPAYVEQQSLHLLKAV